MEPSKLQRFLYALGRGILRLLFRVEVRGLENYHAAGKRVLILPNHISVLDPVLVAFFMPKPTLFAINLFVARDWKWLRPILLLVKSWPIDPTNPFAIRGLITEMKHDKHCVFFPEGRISTTGGMMKIYDGAAMLADKTGAVLLPLHIEGAQFSKFSYLAGKFPLRWFPKITLTFLPPRTIDISKDVSGRKRSELVRIFLHDLMRDSAFYAIDHRKTLFQSLLEARETYGRKRVVALDTARKPMTYDKMITASLILGDRLAPSTKKGAHVGLFLPSSVATVGVYFGLLQHGRIPAMLNYTAGTKSILACCSAACIETVISSHRFVEAGKFSLQIEALQQLGIQIIWLEELSASVTGFDKLLAALRARFLRPSEVGGNPDAPALVLFTSGSEGTPKGVTLSHANILSNRNQLIASIDFCPSDVVMNAMPMFHVFGFVVGTLMPLLTGIKSFYYPTPLHYRLIPLVAYDIDATILFGTDTFLYAYGRNAHPYDFYKVRYAFAGAEKLRERTRQLWGEKFGIRVIEGYGTTETSIVSVNTPLQFRIGTVGRLMPGMEYRTEAVPGIEKGGRFYIKGPNIMLGYLRVGASGAIQPPEDGWYDTGDIIDMNEYGFMSIKGRAKRFAKVGGEMISLTALEEEIEKLWPGVMHAVVAVHNEYKGEQLMLVTENQDARRDELAAFLKEEGYTEVSVPRKIITIEKMPLLGSGKTDYPSVQTLVE